MYKKIIFNTIVVSIIATPIIIFSSLPSSSPLISESFDRTELVSSKIKVSSENIIRSYSIDCKSTNHKIKEGVIFAIGKDKGMKTNRVIDDSKKEAGIFNIYIDEPNKPVFLILGATQPSLWDVKWSEDTIIEEVVVTGTGKQIVLGLESKVNVINRTSKNENCNFLDSIKNNKLKTNNFSEDIYGKKTDKIITNDSVIFVGDGDSINKEYYQSKKIKADDLYIKDIMVGKEGINTLLEQGKIIRASKSRIKEIINLAKPKSHKKIKSKFSWIRNREYIILKPIYIPINLYATSSVIFILNKDVPYPEGDLAHSTLIDLNDVNIFNKEDEIRENNKL